MEAAAEREYFIWVPIGPNPIGCMREFGSGLLNHEVQTFSGLFFGADRHGFQPEKRAYGTTRPHVYMPQINVSSVIAVEA